MQHTSESEHWNTPRLQREFLTDHGHDMRGMVWLISPYHATNIAVAVKLQGHNGYKGERLTNGI